MSLQIQQLMKSTSLFVAGLIHGALAMYLIDGQEGPETGDSGIPAGTAERELEEEVASLRKKVAKLEGEKEAGKIVVARAGDEDKPIRNKRGESPVVKFEGGDKFQDAMKKQREKLKENRVASELTRMRGSLSLTKEQEEAIGGLIEKAKPESGFVSFGGDEEEEGLLSKQEVDAGIRELLDEEQLAAFDELRARDRVNAIEAKANSELASLQRTVNLTEEQKDAAFDVLTDFAAREVDDPRNVMGEGGGWMKRRNEKKEALSEVLTPEQVEIYSATPQIITTSVLGGWSSNTINLGTTTTSEVGGITLEINEEVQIDSE